MYARFTNNLSSVHQLLEKGYLITIWDYACEIFVTLLDELVMWAQTHCFYWRLKACVMTGGKNLLCSSVLYMTTWALVVWRSSKRRILLVAGLVPPSQLPSLWRLSWWQTTSGKKRFWSWFNLIFMGQQDQFLTKLKSIYIYIYTLIDNFPRMTWVYFLWEKS